MARDLSLEQVRDRILETSTKLRDRYAAQRERDMSDPRDLFAITAGQYLMDRFRSTDEGFLRSIFTVFEGILERPDNPASSLVSGVYEHIGGVDPEILDRARHYMGAAGRHLAHQELVINLYEPPRADDSAEIADYYGLGERLVAKLPELRDEYDELVDSYAEDVPSRPGQHVVFGDLLNPYLVEHLRTDDTEALARIFALLEDMSSHENPNIPNVVQVTVCENLSGNHADLVPVALQYMGPHTERLCREIAEILGHPFPAKK